MIILALFGAITGFVAGFFGVGGGMVLIPMLLFANFKMKEAVSISIVQMIFSSVFGTLLNRKQNKEIIKDGLLLGFGGFGGGLFSGLIVSNISGIYLKYLFLTIVVLAIIRVGTIPIAYINNQQKTNLFYLIFIGFVIGTIAMSIGVGGSIMLTPILAGFLHYNLKYASSLGLFFVVFSSIAGFVSLSLTGNMLYFEGLIVGIASLIGVYFGIYVKNHTHIKSYKKLILTLYILIFISMVIRL